jgi:hypothetical protein
MNNEFHSIFSMSTIDYIIADLKSQRNFSKGSLRQIAKTQRDIREFHNITDDRRHNLTSVSTKIAAGPQLRNSEKPAIRIWQE